MVRKTKEDTERTVDDLLDSAMTLFIRKGYSAVTLEQIASGIGMTRGALYHHFSSKEDILNAVIRRERKSFENRLEELFLEKMEPDRHLKTILEHIVSNFFDNKRFNRFIHFTWFKIESSLLEKKFYYQGATNERLVTEISAIIRRGQRSGLFGKETSATVLAMGIVTSILGVYRLSFQSRKYVTRRNGMQLIKHFLHVISSGKKDPAG